LEAKAQNKVTLISYVFMVSASKFESIKGKPIRKETHEKRKQDTTWTKARII